MTRPTKEEMQTYWLDIAKYYAFGECIENRVVSLAGRRVYLAFYNQVYRYIRKLFLDPCSLAEMKPFRNDLCDFAVRAQDKYLAGLKKTVCLKTAQNKVSTPRFGKNAMALDIHKIEVGYNELVELDETKCDFAEMLCSDGAIHPNISFDVEEIRKIAELMYELEIIMVFRQRILKLMNKRSIQFYQNQELHHKKLRDKRTSINRILEYFGNKKAKQRDQITKIPITADQESKKHSHEEPRSVFASLFVFVSHLGRAVCWQCDMKTAEKERRKRADKEFRKSKLYLYRATMDSYKLLLETIQYNEDVSIKRECDLLTSNFWKKVIKARRLEHDRLTHSYEEFMERSRAYKDIFYDPCTLFIEKIKEKLEGSRTN